MARYWICRNGEPVSLETWPTRQQAEGAVQITAALTNRDARFLEVREVPAKVGVSFGTPPTGGK